MTARALSSKLSLRREPRTTSVSASAADASRVVAATPWATASGSEFSSSAAASNSRAPPRLRFSRRRVAFDAGFFAADEHLDLAGFDSAVFQESRRRHLDAPGDGAERAVRSGEREFRAPLHGDSDVAGDGDGVDVGVGGVDDAAATVRPDGDDADPEVAGVDEVAAAETREHALVKPLEEIALHRGMVGGGGSRCRDVEGGEWERAPSRRDLAIASAASAPTSR